MGKKIVKLTPAQKFIANKMVETVRNCPQAVTAFDVDMTELMAIKEENALAGNSITVTAYLIKALSKALGQSPIINSRFLNGEIHMYDEINVGVAMAMPRGLVVPVIHNTEKKSCVEISEELNKLKEKIKNNTLTVDDMTGGTCTISSLGKGKNDLVLPILNDDICLMLGVGSTKKKPIVLDNGEIGVGNIANVSCTTNHCIVYGAEVGKFCFDIAEIIEDPRTYLK